MEDLRKATSGTSEFTDVDIAVYLRICTSAEVGGDLGDLTYDDAHREQLGRIQYGEAAM